MHSWWAQAGLRWLLAGLCCLAGACSGTREPVPDPPEQTGPPWFVDVTDEVGLDFVHDAGAERRHAMPQIVGSGAALFDFDGDGLLDIYLVNNGGPKGAKNRLYRQLPGGKFKAVADSGLEVAGFGMGVAVGDVNNDGLPDVLLTQYGSIRLFLNKGNGKFADITREAGLENPLWGTSACFFDYNRDGWLDLVVVNYVDFDPSWPCTSPGGEPEFCSPQTFKGTASKLYRNLGRPKEGGGEAPVRFADVSLDSGVGRLAGPGLGVYCADFTGDGWPDIFVANDGQANHLWVNQRNDTFKEEAIPRGLAFNAMARPEANMGIAFGDVDGDQLFDVFVTHLNSETNTLWKQGPRGSFRDQTASARLARGRWRGTGWGAVLADFDQDGHLDLALVNGAVRHGPSPNRDLGPYWGPYAERNQLFANDGNGVFRDLSSSNPDFSGTPRIARGLACGVLNDKGALDLLVTYVAGRARLYRNVTPARGHWLLVRAIDPDLRRDAYGAEVTVHAGGRRWLRCVNPGGSYLCSSDPRVHFGLGSAGRVEAIEVLWPGGDRERFEGGPADQFRVLRRGKGTPLKDRPRKRSE